MSQMDAFCFAFVTEPKFICPIHTQAKHTKKLELGAETNLSQGQGKRMGGLCSITPNSSMVLGEKFL